MAPEKTRSRSAYPNDRTRVSSAMRKRRMMAIKRNKIDGFWDGSVYIPDGESLPENTNDVVDSRRLVEAGCVQWQACSENSETKEAAGQGEAVQGHEASTEGDRTSRS
ncbi:hypothetical protein BFJ68_g18539 [Fusarium oxysporum]|uniref:Uncharacterized protein n=1 Tax=Fusarium oxysporum TaxID=5507 RepID=A0A420MHY8_FUSOX|nr:hypothetical protein BFJ68_g18539 [Fusarium oxysporum]